MNCDSSIVFMSGLVSIHNQAFMVNMKNSGCDDVFIGIESGFLEIRRKFINLAHPKK